VGAPPGRLRVAFTKRPHLGIAAPHADCVAAAEDAARLVSSLGHDVEERDLDVDPEALARDFFLVVCVSIATSIAQAAQAAGRRPPRAELQTSTRITAEIGRQRSAAQLAAAHERLDAAARGVARFFERFDVLLTPTLGLPPPVLGALHPHGLERVGHEVLLALRLGVLLRLPGVVDSAVRRVFTFMPFTPLANVTGAPSMTVPLFWNAAGLPIGVMFTGRVGDEATLLRLGAQLEAARPWAGRRPSIHADAAVHGVNRSTGAPF
jgi:amidase